MPQLNQNPVSSAFHTDVQHGQHVLKGAYESSGVFDGFLNSGYFVTMTCGLNVVGDSAGEPFEKPLCRQRVFFLTASGWTMLPRNSNANENV